MTREGVVQGITEANSNAEEDRERLALIGDIGRRLLDLDVEKLRRVDWYMSRVGA